MNLTIKIGKSKFNNPVTVASGTFGIIEKYVDKSLLKNLGALIPKTITLYKQEGNPPPRIAETKAGMINAIGIENPGSDVFIKEKLVSYQKIGVPIIISVLGHSESQFKELAVKLNNIKNVSALELNLSCPNLRKTLLVSQDPKATFKIVKAVKKISKLPIIAKLSPNVTDISIIAKAAEDAGVDGVSMVNTFSAMAIDINKRISKLGNVTGGLSGPAIKPIALNMVYKTAQKVNIPIIAMGGIMNSEDALEFIIAGASMVAIGTANFIDPYIPNEILKGIKKYMKKNKVYNIKKLIGSLR